MTVLKKRAQLSTISWNHSIQIIKLRSYCWYNQNDWKLTARASPLERSMSCSPKNLLFVDTTTLPQRVFLLQKKDSWKCKGHINLWLLYPYSTILPFFSLRGEKNNLIKSFLHSKDLSCSKEYKSMCKSSFSILLFRNYI